MEHAARRPDLSQPDRAEPPARRRPAESEADHRVNASEAAVYVNG